MSTKRVGRPSQDKARITLNLSRFVKEALEQTQGNISTFLEEQALKDDRVAAYVQQKGVCKVAGCKERINSLTDVYCSIPSEGVCPGWLCAYHYDEIHSDGE